MILMATKSELKYDKERFHLRMDPRVTGNRAKLILAWISLWSLCGIIVIAQLFSMQSAEKKVMIGIWILFWMFFLVKAIRLYLWRTAGQEELSGNREVWLYRKFNGSREFKKEIKVSEIRNVNTSDFQSFVMKWSSGDAIFFSIGSPAIHIETSNEKISFGFQLNEDESKKIRKMLEKFDGRN